MSKKRSIPQLQPPRKGSESIEARGLADAQKLLAARKGPAHEYDAPEVTTFAGTKAKQIPGQLSFDGVQVDTDDPWPKDFY